MNLDACGAGGREIVFQAGPGNNWLIEVIIPLTYESSIANHNLFFFLKAYAKAAPYPFANIVAQEIFEARLVPSDTDFKIFRDYGKIPGMK